MIVNADRATFVENIEAAFRIECRAWAAGVPMPEPIIDPASGHAVARIDDALFRVHRWVDGTPGAGSAGEAAQLLAGIHAAGRPRRAQTPTTRWTADRWDAHIVDLTRRMASGPDRMLVVDSHGDLDRKNTLRRADDVLLALDWDAAASVGAVHEAVGVARDWSDAHPSAFAEAVSTMFSTAGSRSPLSPGCSPDGWWRRAAGWTTTRHTGPARTGQRRSAGDAGQAASGRYSYGPAPDGPALVR